MYTHTATSIETAWVGAVGNSYCKQGDGYSGTVGHNWVHLELIAKEIRMFRRLSYVG